MTYDIAQPHGFQAEPGKKLSKQSPMHLQGEHLELLLREVAALPDPGNKEEVEQSSDVLAGNSAEVATAAACHDSRYFIGIAPLMLASVRILIHSSGE